MGANPQRLDWSANRAVDGNINQDYTSGSCAITNIDVNRNTSIWWKVWLERPFNIAYLEIYFEKNNYKKATGFSIFTFDTENLDPVRDPKRLVYQHDPMSGCPPTIQNITVNKVTQGIMFTNERPPGYTSNCSGDNTMYTGIELCEIKAMGCDQHRYLGCDVECPSKCKDKLCDAFNGSCIYGCNRTHFLPPHCNACIPHYYEVTVSLRVVSVEELMFVTV
ncbi:uncharacterized protein LOC111114376 [Crassostrea virginica]